MLYYIHPPPVLSLRSLLSLLPPYPLTGNAFGGSDGHYRRTVDLVQIHSLGLSTLKSGDSGSNRVYDC